jgi:glycosyltransferase involved in cell wall biosynthesis
MAPRVLGPGRVFHHDGDAGLMSRALEIALVSTTATATPPRAYGGTELVVAELAQALVGLGHRPTVFATGDSRCAGSRRAIIDHPVWPPDTLTEVRHAAFAWEEIATGTFDVVHVNHAAAIPFCRLVRRPTVATIHHDREDSLSLHYGAYPEVGYVAISSRQRALAPQIPFCAVVRHGLDVDRYPYGEGTGGYCAFLGRFAPEKGPHLAIDAALAAGRPIRLGGEAHHVAKAYFDRELVPRLARAGVDWLGEVGGPRKLDLLADAECLLFPIQWEEPFGLVMIEAMLVGTPVIAFPRGSIPEVVEEGVTGFIVRDASEMAERIRSIAAFDRRRCRERARERWSSLRMARDYVDQYRAAIERASPRAPRQAWRADRGPASASNTSRHR